MALPWLVSLLISVVLNVVAYLLQDYAATLAKIQGADLGK